MELTQLRLALSQVLENYQRCGVSYLSRDAATLPDSAAAALAELQSAAANSRQAIGQPAKSMATADSGSAAAMPSQAVVPPAAVTQVPLGSWELPVLDTSKRQAELDGVRQQVAACRLCKDIVSFRQQIVFGAGKVNPRVCFMGEAPGADEDRTGEPFVGAAGQLLTKIIGAMQLTREEVYILNALRCRPPQNRTPVPEEIANCRPFVTAQLEILKPEFIVCLGAVAARSLLDSTESIGRMRGRFHQYRGARVVVTYHPSYLLRNESAKRLVWEDMKMLMRELGAP